VSWLVAQAVGYGSARHALAALAAAMVVGLIAYVAVLGALRSDELGQLRSALRRRRPTTDPPRVGE
jgi:hypothetical protein